MKVDNFLPKALFISLALHTVFICWTYLIKVNDPKQKQLTQKRVEISYRAPKPKAVDVQQRPIKPVQQLDLSSSMPEASAESLPVKLSREGQMMPGQMTSMYERKPEKIRSMQMTRRVSITPIKSEKINNPAYAAYNEIVRSRIEEKVYVNYNRIEQGTVYLTFIINAQGQLKAAQIIAEKTNASERLQEVSIKSLKDASPFPVFLKGMTLPEYSFNIEVQYQVRD